jgi:glycosyltransferase involved in cell wall biosynthesis
MTVDAVGGAWTYASELCSELARRGIEVHLACLGPEPAAWQREQIAELPGARLSESCAKLEWMDEPWADVDASREWLLELARDVRPDVVHLNGYCHATLPFDAPACVVAHSCFASWWSAVFGEALPERYDEYRRRVAAGIAAADRVVAPSRAMLDELRRHYGGRGGCVIPNGVRLARYAGARRKAPVVLAAGRVWDRAKNLTALAGAARELPWPVRIAGDGVGSLPGADSYENVTFLGQLSRSRMAEELASAAIFAHPARYEPFGLAALEAAAAGSALVLGDVPSLREVWGSAAVYVEPTNLAQLTRVLRELMDDPAACHELQRRAVRQAQRYTGARCAEAYASLYEAMLGDALARGRHTRRSAQHATQMEQAR